MGHANTKKISLKDKVFGKLTVKEYIGGKNSEWLCECECGAPVRARYIYIPSIN